MHMIFRVYLIACLLIFAPACTKSKMVFDDISRDIYEQNRNRQIKDNMLSPHSGGKEPLPYDQYQREKREALADSENNALSKEATQ